MYCRNCGEKLPDGASFCPNCGTAVSGNDDSDAENTDKDTSSRSDFIRERYERGCLAAARQDMRYFPSAGKLLLLALVNLIPILNFFVDGFAFNWSSEVPYGKQDPRPKVFTSRNFKIGFFIFVVVLVLVIIYAVVQGLLSFIPIIGAICMIIVVFIYFLFRYLSGMRVAMSQTLKAGFSFGKIWHACGGRLASAVWATIVPEIIFEVVAMILGLIVLFSFFGDGWAVLSNALASGEAENFEEAIEAVFTAVSEISVGTWVAISIVMIAYGYVTSLLEVLAHLLSARAIGHYVSRYVPDWVAEFPSSAEPPSASAPANAPADNPDATDDSHPDDISDSSDDSCSSDASDLTGTPDSSDVHASNTSDSADAGNSGGNS